MFINQSIHRLINTIISFVINIVILIYIYNNVTLTTLSDFAISVLIFQYIFLFTEWGFNLYSIQRIRNKEFIDKRHYFINIIIYSKFILATISCLFLVFLYFNKFILVRDKLTFYSCLFLVFTAAFNPLWLFQSIKKIQLLNLPLLFLKIVQLIFIYYFLTSTNIYIFFLSQGIIFCLMFLYSLYYLYKNFYYFFKFSLKQIYLSLFFLKKMFLYFLSNLYNHLNLTIWGSLLIFLNANDQIILFNIVDTIWRSFNTFLQSILEPTLKSLKKISFRKKNIFYLLIFLIIFYLNIEILTPIIFKYKPIEFIEIFELLFFILLLFSTNKFILFLIYGKKNLLKMNLLNCIFLFLEFFCAFLWLFFSEKTTFSILYFLLFINLIKFIILTIGFRMFKSA